VLDVHAPRRHRRLLPRLRRPYFHNRATRRDPTVTHHRNPRSPFLDDHSITVIANAEAALSAKRAADGGDEHADDIVTEIHSLASLRLQLDEHLYGIVTEAREDGCSWRDIAQALGVTTTHARRRYKPAPSRIPQPKTR
jgi:hypothetical protein